jgi:tetratricopeptide (TPR) repeat protein
MKRLLPLLLFASLVSFGCQSSSEPPATAITIADEKDFAAKLGDARLLSEGALKAQQAGQTLDKLDLENLEKALVIFNGLVAFEPKALGLYLGAAKIEVALGREEAAVDRLSVITRRYFDTKTDADRETLAECLGELGRIQVRRKLFADAEKTLNTALEMFPRNLDYTAELAGVMIEQRRYAEARKLLDQNRKLSPNHARTNQLTTLLELSQGSR